MPKMKTISGAKKRFRKTGSGRIKRKKAFHRHNLGGNNGNKGRDLRASAMVHPSDERQVKRMLLM